MEIELLLHKYKLHSRNVTRFLIVSGLWPNSEPIAKKIISFAAMFSLTVVILGILNFSFQNITNIMALTKGIGLAVSFSSAFLKVVIILKHQDDLIHLNNFLTADYMRDMQHCEHRSDLLNYVTISSVFLYMHAIMVGFTFSMYASSPIFALRKYGKYIRTFPVIFPFSYEPGGIVHWILYGVEVSCCIFLWTVTVGVDCVFGLYALQTCGELRILAKKFSSLNLDSDYKKNLKDCIQRHHVIINAKNRLEATFGLISIWIVISSALILCSLIFQVTEALKSNAGFAHTSHMSAYLFPKFLQVFMYAWYGNLITKQSEACLDSIYNSDWTDSCDSRFKNDIVIVMTQKPLEITAKGFMLVQLDMFAKIAKTSVSYFFLLQTLTENN